MGEPTRKRYLAPLLVPQGARLRNRIVRGKHLLVHIPKFWSDSALAAVVNRLSGELPENYEVFDAGAIGHWKRVTVMEVISKDEVLTIAPTFLGAARRFRAEARELAHQLAELNGVPASQLLEHSKNCTVYPEGWDAFRHGIHYCFTHRETGRQIEVCISFGEEFGVLDPYFFYQYMTTTQGIGVPQQIVEPYHDTRRAMQLLEANGSLTRITCGEWATGVFAAR